MQLRESQGKKDLRKWGAITRVGEVDEDATASDFVTLKAINLDKCNFASILKVPGE